MSANARVHGPLNQHYQMEFGPYIRILPTICNICIMFRW